MNAVPVNVTPGSPPVPASTVPASTVPASTVPASTVPRIPPDPAARDQSWPERWPLRDFLEMAAVTEAVPSARLHARQVLREWQAGELACDAELITGELVANAVTATREARWPLARPPVRLWLLARRGEVLILVWDATPGVPRLGIAGPDDESGRGLMMVDALARWNFYRPPGQHEEKVVWASIPR